MNSNIQADLTIYNKYYDTLSGADKYKKTILKGAYIFPHKKEKDAQTKIIIPFRVNSGAAVYKDAKAFQANHTNAWTLKQGDFIVKGQCEFVYTELTGGALKDLINGYDNVFKIEDVKIADFGTARLRHFEVTAV